MKVKLINELNGNVKEVKVGFSWTTFFFGAFVPLFRKDWLGLLVMAVLLLVVSYITGGYGSIFVAAGLGAFYNNNYIKRLLADNYNPCDEGDVKLLNSKGISSKN